MNPLSRGRVLGIGLGLGLAGAASVAGVAAERLWRDRGHAIALGREADFVVQPSSTLVVIADDGVPLHVEVDEPETPDPARPTVVLCHGYTLDLRCWVFQRRALQAAGYRVVLWDQRGHGSSGTGDLMSYHVEQLGADLRRVIDDVVPDGDLALVGHSMGGMTVMALAEADPTLVRDRLVAAALISTSAGGLHRVTWGLGSLLGGAVTRAGPHALQRLAGRQDLVDTVLRSGREVQDLVVAKSAFGSPVPLSVVRLTGEMIFGTTMEVMSAFATGLNRHDKAAALEHLRAVDVLVLHGDHDMLLSPAHAEEIVAELPDAEHVLVRGAGHVITLEHPEVVSQHLLDLLDRARSAREGGEAGDSTGRRGTPRAEGGPPVPRPAGKRRRLTRSRR